MRRRPPYDESSEKPRIARSGPLRGVALVWALVAFFCMTAVCIAARAQSHVDGELMVEQRLVAPCCWVQTLDVHDSPVAKDLRAEIHRRLVAGEPASVIEADLVERYGERIRAMPPGNPLAKAAAVVSVVVLIMAILLALVVRRWIKRQQVADAGTEPAPGAAARDEYDDKLDEQLRKMD
jgi:cytochrome c-type biogenesis protein CcmH